MVEDFGCQSAILQRPDLLTRMVKTFNAGKHEALHTCLTAVAVRDLLLLVDRHPEQHARSTRDRGGCMAVGEMGKPRRHQATPLGGLAAEFDVQ